MHERVWGKAVEEVERDDRRRDDESREGANDVRGRALEAERGRQRTRESTEELAEQLGRQRKEGVTGSAAEILERSLLKTDVTAEQANQADERTRDHEDDAGAAKDRKPTKNDAEGDTAASNAIKGGVAADRGRVVQKRKRDGGDEADAGTAAKRTRADSEGDGVGQKSVGIALR